MFDSCIIEIEDHTAGILVREGDAFAFHTASPRFFGLQGTLFAGPMSAEMAIKKLLRSQKSVGTGRSGEAKRQTYRSSAFD